jgi:deazaflavin-dependent oxidoreductase (nitroreductase family)
VANNWNDKIIEEFRTNEGKVGGPFEGAPMVLMHHSGRKTGIEHVNPVMYQAGEGERIYVFASKGGAPTNPDWYYNMTSAGRATVEVGTETYPVTVTEVTGEERDRIFAEQVRRYPGFGGYEQKTRGIRTIPVLALDRAR